MSREKLKPTITDAAFWVDVWNEGNLFFHSSNNHPYLVKHLDKLIEENKSIRILFPFCGKEVDMAWLASLGHEVVGVEFVQTACEQFFKEQNIKFNVSEVKDFKIYTSEDGRIKIYNGDFYKFSTDLEKPFECVWDRGSFEALHYELRVKYTQTMLKLLSTKVRYLLEVFEYDTALYSGPPHCVKIEEIKKLFGSEFRIELIDSQIAMVIKLPAEINPLDQCYFISRD